MGELVSIDTSCDELCLKGEERNRTVVGGEGGVKGRAFNLCV